MVAQLTGFLLGILASVIAWYLAVGVITPKVEIRPSLELIREPGRSAKYRIAIRNGRLFRRAEDVSIRVRCSYLRPRKGLKDGRIRCVVEIPLDEPWLPVLRSRWYRRRHRHRDRPSDGWLQRPVLYVDQMEQNAVAELPKDADGLVDLAAVLATEDLKGRVQVTVIAYDSWSGTRKLFYKALRPGDVQIHGSQHKESSAPSVGAAQEPTVAPAEAS
jgi:hypothetical protein